VNFKRYRQAAGYSESTIRVQDSHVNQFLSWCMTQGIDPGQITYNQILQFIDHERTRHIKQQSIAGMLNSLKVYFDFLVDTGVIAQNVFRRIRIHQVGRRALPQVLTVEQMEKLYRDFANLPPWHLGSDRSRLTHQRDTVTLGLMIFQGLNSGQIARLERTHLNLAEGKIYIPSGRKSNARILRLQTMQILPMKTYLDTTRRQLIEMQQDQGRDTDQYLFPVKKSSEMVARIIHQLRRIDPEVTSSRQIRSSVIMGWLKAYNIRQVQYMAGHKSIRSTESYRIQDLTDLTRQLELFHPLR
jgi:site-specific recombinase XerD